MWPFRKIIADRVALEEVKNKLQAVCGPERYPVMLKLADERREESKRRSTCWGIGELTEREAIESVFQDVCYGYLK